MMRDLEEVLSCVKKWADDQSTMTEKLEKAMDECAVGSAEWYQARGRHQEALAHHATILAFKSDLAGSIYEIKPYTPILTK